MAVMIWQPALPQILAFWSLFFCAAGVRPEMEKTLHKTLHYVPESGDCWTPDTSKLPQLCSNFKPNNSVCFADVLAPGATKSDECPVADGEIDKIIKNMAKNAAKTDSSGPVFFFALGGMGAGKSRALEVLHEHHIADHAIGTKEVNLCWDDILMSLGIFKKAADAPKIPMGLFGHCIHKVANTYEKLYNISVEKKANAYLEAFSMVEDPPNMAFFNCKVVQKFVDDGFNLVTVFVHSNPDRGLCNVLSRQEQEKRYASIESTSLSYDGDSDGAKAKQCWDKIKVTNAKYKKWIYCENGNREMKCHKPVVENKGE